MTGRSIWSLLPEDYCAREMAVVASWIASGESGSVLGLPGMGRSMFLEFLSHRPNSVRRYLPQDGHKVSILPVDLNNLPDSDLVTLYRAILRSFYEAQHQFEPVVRRTIRDLFYANRATRDAFVAQTALRQLLLLLQAHEVHAVLVLNRFDDFCREATPRMTKTLLGLRDSFKATLSFIAGMQQEVIYLADLPAIDPLHHLLDAQVCWIGTLNEADARDMVRRHTERLGVAPLAERQAQAILSLSGGFPSLIRVICQRLLSQPEEGVAGSKVQRWLHRADVRYRLERLWNGLTQEEQVILAKVQKRQGQDERDAPWDEKELQGLQQLRAKGLCGRASHGWEVTGTLLSCYVGEVAGHSRGRIWLAEKTGKVYQGAQRLADLPPLEHEVLAFLLEHPYMRHTHTDIIEAAWPADVAREGVATEALYQVIRGLRKKIEPDASRPRYVINWRGLPEGGYQFYPEGRPE